MRAIGVSRAHVVQQIVLEGVAIIVSRGRFSGSDSALSPRAISTRSSRAFPGLPTAIDFFLFQREGSVDGARASDCRGDCRGNLSVVARGVAADRRDRCARRRSRDRVQSSSDVRRDYPIGADRARARAARRVARRRAGRLRRDRRTVGLRQVDAAQSHRRHRSSDVGHGDDRGAARRRDARPRGDALSSAQHRLRVSALLSDADALGDGERRAADGRGEGSGYGEKGEGARSCSPTSDLARDAIIGRRSCRAASSSASRSRARWRIGRPFCSPTSRPVSSTRKPAPR